MTFVNPADTPDRRTEKLIRITQSLMRRVEQAQTESASAYEQFQRAVMLEEEVRQRTRDLEATLALLNRSNAQLASAMEAEKRARADLSTALEAVQEGFALFGGDGRMIMFNSRFCRSLPDVREGLHVGVDLNDYFDLVSRSGHLDRADSGEPQDWADWRRRQRRERHAIFNVKLRDGSVFQISEHRTPDGGAAILQTDVTEMIRLERRERARLLDDQARLIRATLDHIDQGVVIFDQEERLAWWNRRLGVLLTPPMRLVRIGVRFRALFDGIAETTRFRGEASSEGVIDWVEHRLERPPLTFEMALGDRILTVLAQVMPDGGFVMSFADVTAERDAAAALHEANEALERRVAERTRALEDALGEAKRANASKSRFVAAASHDLLQPLSAAKLFVAAAASLPIEDGAALAVRRAHSALESVETFIDELLEISKLDCGAAAMKAQLISVGALLDRLQEEFSPMAEAKGLRLRVRPTDVDVISDPNYFRRILQNLMSNAIRYTTSGGVLVGVRRRGGSARVEVWDTGPGIPEERQQEIFEEFNRLDATVDAADGLGLGLSIVDRAAQMLGHRLSLRSQVGRGSCFAVDAPIADAAHAPAPLSLSPRPMASAGLLVVVIAAETELRESVARLLESWGVFVFEAATETEALATLNETEVRADAILMDSTVATPSEALTRLTEAYGPTPTAVIAPEGATPCETRRRMRGWTSMASPIEPTQMSAFLDDAARRGDAVD